MRFARAIAAAVLLAAGLQVAPVAAPSPVAGIGPLPECKLLDILTVPRGYDDWATTLVDWNLSVGPDYKPPDLVSVHKAGLGGGGLVREVAVADLTALVKAAKTHGTPLSSWSAYRGYKQQDELFTMYAKGYGYDSAVRFSHRPGHSEHQLGLTIDFVAVGDTHLTSNWEVTRTGGWMAANAWKYGWVMSYPKVPFDTICFTYEPWHYRYLGRDLAKKIHDSGLTIREYLWANFTQLDTAFQPVSSATPSALPTVAPTVTPDVTLTPLTTNDATSPGSSAGPAAPTGSRAGLDPAVILVIVLIVVAGTGMAYALNRARRRYCD